jgi:hypothetical protein
LHGESFAKRGKHRAVLFEPQLLFDGDLDLEVEDPNEELAQLPTVRFADERRELAPSSNDAQHAQCAVASRQKMMSLSREQLGGWATAELRSDTIVRFELTQSAEKPGDVAMIARVNDVEIEGRNGGALDRRGHPTDRHEANPTTAKNGEKGGETTRRRHGEAR